MRSAPLVLAAGKRSAFSSRAASTGADHNNSSTSRLVRPCDWTPRPSAKQRKERWKDELGKSVQIQPAVAQRSFEEAGLSSLNTLTDEGNVIKEVIPPQNDAACYTMVAPDLHTVSGPFGTSYPIEEDLLHTCGFDLSQVTAIWQPPSPSTDTIFGTAVAFAGLASASPITTQDQDALNFYAGDCSFGFGSKRPEYSTHEILRRNATHSQTLNHLLLAAASGECWYARGATDSLMLENAARNYAIGRRLLDSSLSDPDSDPLEVMGSFWFLYISQRRRLAKFRIDYQSLSASMAEYITRSRLVDILLSPTENHHPPQPQAATNYAPKARSLLARLVTWLFWVDAQACFQGDGGAMARALVRSTTTRGLLDIFELSSNALWLNFDVYPPDEVLDDTKNKNTFKMMHQFWVLMQEINGLVIDENEHCELDEEQSQAIQTKIDALRRSPSVSSIFICSESKTKQRDRELANCDWAVANFYAMCIYHRRCTAQPQRERPSHHRDGSGGMLDALLTLIQKSLAVPGKGQIGEFLCQVYVPSLPFCRSPTD